MFKFDTEGTRDEIAAALNAMAIPDPPEDPGLHAVVDHLRAVAKRQLERMPPAARYVVAFGVGPDSLSFSVGML